MNLKTGDNVLIQGGLHSQQLLEDIAHECYRVGALPLVSSRSDDLSTRVMRDIPAKTLEQTPRHLLGAVKGMDCMINIDAYDDPSITSAFPRAKMEAKSKAGVPLMKVLDGEGRGVSKKWCFAGWPTRKQAKFYGISYGLYERLIIDGLTVPIPTLRRRCETIGEFLKEASHLHVTDPEGTDFELKIGKRKRNLDDGFVSDEDVEANDKGNNLPAGEVFVAPHESWGSGTLFCPITRDSFTGKMIRNTELRFSKGRLDLERTKAPSDQETIVETFKQALRVDEATQKRLRTMNVAEIGIGCNPRTNKAIGFVLTDEKITGSVHLAFGSNISYGGTSQSIMHWDFVTAPKVTLVARTEDGSERTAIKNGRLQKY
jgi:aminopeptidase